MFGLEKHRFLDLSDSLAEQLLCGICLGIFMDPIVTHCCRQTYCSYCIKLWIYTYNKCANDRCLTTITSDNQLLCVPIHVCNQLSKLKVTCDYRNNGCNQILLLESYVKHIDNCEYNPEGIVCDTMYDNKSLHNCCETLRNKVRTLEILNESLATKFNLVSIENTILSRKVKKEIQENQTKTQEIEALTQLNNTIKQQIFNLSSSVQNLDIQSSQRFKPNIIGSETQNYVNKSEDNNWLKNINFSRTIYNDSVTDDGIEAIKCGDNGVKYKCELNCERIYYGYICGKNVNTKKAIENETKTKIYVPRNGGESQSLITINGQTRDAVKLAKSRIEALVAYKISKKKCTHFISFPINKSEIIDRFNAFKQNVLTNDECLKSRGINERLFQMPNKLHVTNATLFLSDKTDIDNANDILNQCFNDYIKKLTKGPIPIKVEGIVHMTNDPTKVTTIYARVIDLSENQCLQQMVNEIYNRFEKTKYLDSPPLFGEADYRINDGLNMVVMRSAFKHFNRYESFDATAIMKHFSDYSFGHTLIDTIHISVCRSCGPDGYYMHTHLIRIDSH